MERVLRVTRGTTFNTDLSMSKNKPKQKGSDKLEDFFHVPLANLAYHFIVSNNKKTYF